MIAAKPCAKEHRFLKTRLEARLDVPDLGRRRCAPVGDGAARRIAIGFLVIPALLSAQWSYGGDVALRSRYEWRGITRHDGWVLQPDLFASAGTPALQLTVGAWGNVELAGPDAVSGIGLGQLWFGEANAWWELAFTAGPFDIASGWTSYVFPHAARASGLPGGLHDTDEVYGRAALASLPFVVPHVAVWYDLDAVRGAYFEGGADVRVPAWTRVLFPVGSLVLGAVVGYSDGQEANPAAPAQAAYFARRGFTHLDLSAALVVGYMPLGALQSAVRVEYHLQRGWDPRTRIASATDGDRSVKGWFGLSFSALGPRCRPSRGVCPR